MFLSLDPIHYIGIIVGVIIVGVILYFAFKPRKEVAKETEEANPEEVKVVEEEIITPAEPVKEKKTEPKKEVVETVTKEEVEASESEVEETTETKAVKIPKYHVSQNKDEKSENFKKWRVRKEGSNKTIKFFTTQKEAIAFAEDLAVKAGSSVVIHKVDGSIRKQDYAKKEE